MNIVGGQFLIEYGIWLKYYHYFTPVYDSFKLYLIVLDKSRTMIRILKTRYVDIPLYSLNQSSIMNKNSKSVRV